MLTKVDDKLIVRLASRPLRVLFLGDRIRLAGPVAGRKNPTKLPSPGLAMEMGPVEPLPIAGNRIAMFAKHY